MLKGESIVEVQKRFTHIVNHLMSLGKIFDKEELNKVTIDLGNLKSRLSQNQRT